jgi:hypothetical protein
MKRVLLHNRIFGQPGSIGNQRPMLRSGAAHASQWGHRMPDPVAAQTLFDALTAFMVPTASHRSLYTVAKDFQSIGTGVFAVAAATIAYFGAMHAASKAYGGVIKRIEFDKDVFQEERKASRRAGQSRKYGMLLRVRYEVKNIRKDADIVLLKLEPIIETKERQVAKLEEAQSSRLLTDAKLDYVEWRDDFSLGEYDELEKAWRKIDLFTLSNIFVIDNLRGALEDAKEKEQWCLKDRNEDGNVPLVHARLYRDSCRDVRRQAEALGKGLQKPITELAKVAGIESLTPK